MWRKLSEIQNTDTFPVKHIMAERWQLAMKKNIVPIAARIPAVIFVLEDFLGGDLSWRKAGPKYLLWDIIFLSFVLADRLIYQTDGERSGPMKLRKYGYLWYVILYAPLLILSAMYDICFLTMQAKVWIGIPLFLAKLLAIAFLGLQLSRMETAGGRLEKEDLSMIVLLGILAAFSLFQEYAAVPSALGWAIDLLILAVFSTILLYPLIHR